MGTFLSMQLTLEIWTQKHAERRRWVEMEAGIESEDREKQPLSP